MVSRLCLILFGILVSSAIFGFNCGQCKTIRRQQLKLQKEQSRINQMIVNQQAAQKNLGPDQVSQQVKIKSDLLTLNLRAEAIRNNLIAIGKKLGQCNRCPVPGSLPPIPKASPPTTKKPNQPSSRFGTSGSFVTQPKTNQTDIKIQRKRIGK